MYNTSFNFGLPGPQQTPISTQWLNNMTRSMEGISTPIAGMDPSSVKPSFDIMSQQQSSVNPMLENLGTGMDILGGLAQIYLGFQANKLANKNLNFQIGAYNNNLENTVQSYNTALSDRINARHFTEGKSAADTTAYLNENKLKANTI